LGKINLLLLPANPGLFIFQQRKVTPHHNTKMKKLKTLFCNHKVAALLLIIITGLLFTSCNEELDITKQYYKFRNKETPIYSKPHGKIVGYFLRKHKLDCIGKHSVEDGWIKTSLKGFKKEIYLHPDDMQKMTVTEMQANCGKPTLLSKTFTLGSGSPSPFKGASEGVRATINIRGYGTCTGTIYNGNYFENDSRTVIAVYNGDWLLQKGFESRDDTIDRCRKEDGFG
jgi:hypothetical protein